MMNLNYEVWLKNLLIDQDTLIKRDQKGLFFNIVSIAVDKLL